MITAIAGTQSENRTPRQTLSRAIVTSLLCLTLVGLLTTAPTQAAVTITLAGGVQNPPPNKSSLVPETAIADKATLVPVANFSGILQSVLDAGLHRREQLFVGRERRAASITTQLSISSSTSSS